ncbi:WG repeat-containing protein [Candidatus Parcubacteria bacterium]|jgi:hypothetical protein|nr:WG repeat-containing protein [Candidatus Parcubacteria bacterium]MBT7228633.1 WG repeat-containing protein [Candidatus Parcubacteria bacterium]
MTEKCEAIGIVLSNVKHFYGVFDDQLGKTKDFDSLRDLKKRILHNLNMSQDSIRVILAEEFGLVEVRVFKEGLAAARAQRGLFYIDPLGNMVIKGTFDSAGAFEDGKAKVCLNSECWYIDKTGKRIGDKFNRYG